MAYPFAGKSASITVGGTAKPLDKFEVSIDGAPIDYTNFTSSGWQLLTGGVKKAKISASGPYNGIASAGSAGDVAGTSVAFVLDFGSSGPSLTITALLSKINASTDVNGIAQISYEADSTGAPTITY